jgi:polyphosphate kinase
MDKNHIFFNRETSWLEFNNRVLEEACDRENPLLERLKFISIFFNNLDEFIMVRISAIISQINSGKIATDQSGHTPQELVSILHKKIKNSTDTAYQALNEDILKNLEKEGITVYDSVNIPAAYNDMLLELFLKKYFLILTPMAIDQSRPFPFLSGKLPNVLFCLENPKNTRERLYAVIPLPDNEPLVAIPGGGKAEFIYLSEMVKLFAGHFFKGYRILNSSTFRITRDAELNIDEEGAEDLLSVIQEELRKREKGAPIRLEVESSITGELFEYLKNKIGFFGEFCFKTAGYPDPTAFFRIASIGGFDHLKDSELIPSLPIAFSDPNENIFSSIAKKDVILNLPFESFDPVVRLINEAADDDRVLAIKQTLYRTSWNTPIVAALMRASENGKQVTVLIELKARFDEEQNINWAKQLEEKGCHVIYGLVGLKTHCKILLIVRDEDDGIKRYVHLSTGNYNDKTARIYTDIGLFTARNSFGRDVSSVFNVLTGYSELPHWKKIVTAPVDMRNYFFEKIDVEMDNVKNGGKGRIIAKMNSLVDTKIIEKLYDASCSGVKINLLVRGMCCLVPGMKGMSENITVTSIVDRFLEHSRIYYFYNAGNEDIYLSSADWMERNFDRRIEILYPVEDDDNKKEILSMLKIYFNDNVKSRHLKQDGVYEKTKQRKGEKKVRSQIEIYKFFVDKNRKKTAKARVFKPKMNPDDVEKLI